MSIKLFIVMIIYFISNYFLLNPFLNRYLRLFLYFFFKKEYSSCATNVKELNNGVLTQCFKLVFIKHVLGTCYIRTMELGIKRDMKMTWTMSPRRMKSNWEFRINKNLTFYLEFLLVINRFLHENQSNLIHS